MRVLKLPCRPKKKHVQIVLDYQNLLVWEVPSGRSHHQRLQSPADRFTTSVGQLVVAAVSGQALGPGVLRLGSLMAREQYSIEKNEAEHAELPSLGVARRLVAA
jgi:hypothetical protein